MRQFYSTYRKNRKVSALLRQLPWTHNLLIIGQCKLAEEREFYLRMATREKWTKRELERQLRAALFERAILNPPKVSALVTQIHPDALTLFKVATAATFL
jgi:predicted nuclease of restriction endonuclease-like (RecB) superfamily